MWKRFSFSPLSILKPTLLLFTISLSKSKHKISKVAASAQSRSDAGSSGIRGLGGADSVACSSLVEIPQGWCPRGCPLWFGRLSPPKTDVFTIYKYIYICNYVKGFSVHHLTSYWSPPPNLLCVFMRPDWVCVRLREQGAEKRFKLS